MVLYLASSKLLRFCRASRNLKLTILPRLGRNHAKHPIPRVSRTEPDRHTGTSSPPNASNRPPISTSFPPPNSPTMDYHLGPPAKRRRTRELIPPPPRHPDAAAIITEDLAAHMVNRANAQILQTVGFTGCTRVVQESLRSLAEDCMLAHYYYHCHCTTLHYAILETRNDLLTSDP